MNLSGVIGEDNAAFQQFDVNVTQQPQQQDELRAAIVMLHSVMDNVCLALGVPGNVLSAIIWLRRHATGKNSSALYLAVLAISDLLYLLFYKYLRVYLFVRSGFIRGSWVNYCIYTMYLTADILEPLLVLSFSVERLIAISFPLQVRCVRLCNVTLSYFKLAVRLDSRIAE